MGNRSRYRKAAELYVTGTELELKDGSVIWCQVLNDFEITDARRQAAAARSRYSMAMHEVGSEEYDTLRSNFLERGRDLTILDILAVRQPDHLVLATNELEADEEWKERYEILHRSEEIDARDESDPEKQLLNKINEDWLAAINEIIELEQGRARRQLESMDDDALFEEYRDEWVERRAGGLAMEAYALREVFHGARCCEGIRDEEGKFGPKAHEQCDHRERAFETEDDLKELPGELYSALRTAFDTMNMTVREAKN